MTGYLPATSHGGFGRVPPNLHTLPGAQIARYPKLMRALNQGYGANLVENSVKIVTGFNPTSLAVIVKMPNGYFKVMVSDILGQHLADVVVSEVPDPATQQRIALALLKIEEFHLQRNRDLQGSGSNVSALRPQEHSVSSAQPMSPFETAQNLEARLKTLQAEARRNAPPPPEQWQPVYELGFVENNWKTKGYLYQVYELKPREGGATRFKLEVHTMSYANGEPITIPLNHAPATTQQYSLYFWSYSRDRYSPIYPATAEQIAEIVRRVVALANRNETVTFDSGITVPEVLDILRKRTPELDGKQSRVITHGVALADAGPDLEPHPGAIPGRPPTPHQRA